MKIEPLNPGELRDGRLLRQVTNGVPTTWLSAVFADPQAISWPLVVPDGAIGTFITIDSSGSIRKIETFSQVNGNDGSISERTLVRRRSVSGFQCQGTARSRI
jgi:hypothetical protein